MAEIRGNNKLANHGDPGRPEKSEYLKGQGAGMGGGKGEEAVNASTCSKAYGSLQKKSNPEVHGNKGHAGA